VQNSVTHPQICATESGAKFCGTYPFVLLWRMGQHVPQKSQNSVAHPGCATKFNYLSRENCDARHMHHGTTEKLFSSSVNLDKDMYLNYT
jgi:hypothetical protein